MNKSTFKLFCSLLRQNTGISLDETKEYLLQSRLTPIAKKYSCETVDVLVEKLVSEHVGLKHWEAFVALTTNETHFFRDNHFFDGIRDYILPNIISERLSVKTLKIWSAASSTGQEAYSLAMLIRDFYPGLLNWKIEIFATDISPDNILRAKLGIYNQIEAERGLNSHCLNRHFSKLQDGRYRINDDIRSMVFFTKLNLIRAWPMLPQYDLILLRNVMIYFDKPTRDLLLSKIHKNLSSSGYLVLGATETIFANQSYNLHQFKRFSCYSPNF